MNNKFKIINFDPLQIEILDDLKKGQIIDLSAYFNSAEAEFEKTINNFINKKFQEQLTTLEQKLTTQFNEKLKVELTNQELEIKNQNKDEINKLNNTIISLTKDKQNIRENTILEQKNIYDNELNKLHNQINILNEQKDSVEKLTKAELDKKHLEQVHALTNTIEKNKNEYELDKLKLEKDHNLEIEALTKQLNDQIQAKQDEINELKRNKSLLGTKALGEELENWCKQQIEDNLINVVGNDGSIIIDKFHNNDEKADFFVEIKNPNIETEKKLSFKIILEMKTEALDTKESNKKTNLSYIDKLVKNAEKENGHVAILVTEREREDNFLIKRVNNQAYKTNLEIFMVRPQLLVYLISILRIIYIKYIAITQLDSIKFYDSKKILDDFEDFKNSILDNALKHINTKANEIVKAAETIANNAQKIIDAGNLIISTHVEKISKKINDFNIESKVVKKIKKIDNSYDDDFEQVPVAHKKL